MAISPIPFNIKREQVIGSRQDLIDAFVQRCREKNIALSSTRLIKGPDGTGWLNLNDWHRGVHVDTQTAKAINLAQGIGLEVVLRVPDRKSAKNAKDPVFISDLDETHVLTRAEWEEVRDIWAAHKAERAKRKS